MDDLFLFAEQESSNNKIKEKLGRCLRISDLGQPKRILGLEVTWHSGGSVSMQLAPQIQTVLNETGKEN